MGLASVLYGCDSKVVVLAVSTNDSLYHPLRIATLLHVSAFHLSIDVLSALSIRVGWLGSWQCESLASTSPSQGMAALGNGEDLEGSGNEESERNTERGIGRRSDFDLRSDGILQYIHVLLSAMYVLC